MKRGWTDVVVPSGFFFTNPLKQEYVKRPYFYENLGKCSTLKRFDVQNTFPKSTVLGVKNEKYSSVHPGNKARLSVLWSRGHRVGLG